MSAKSELRDVEIRGPSVHKKTKDVEYSIFLPYSLIDEQDQKLESALDYFLKAVVKVLQSLEIDTTMIEDKTSSLIKYVLSKPDMFEPNET